MGGREGPRPPLGLHEHHASSSVRPTSTALRAKVEQAHRGDPTSRRARRRASASPRPPEWVPDHDARPRLPPPHHRRPGARRRCGAARPRGGGDGDAPRPVPSAVGVHRSSKASKAAGPRSCRRSTTRSPTASAALKLSLSLLDFEADPPAPPEPSASQRIAAEAEAERRAEAFADPVEARLAGERSRKGRRVHGAPAARTHPAGPRIRRRAPSQARSRRAAASTTPFGSPDRCGGRCS